MSEPEDQEPEEEPEVDILGSILLSIKKLLGIEHDYTHFDQDIIMYINGVLMTLNQLGVGSEDGFAITGSEDTWADFLGEVTNLEAVKAYIYLKVRLIFDPPSGSAIIQAFERQITEFEWRLNVQTDEL
jgi:hypothetical protein